MTDHRSGQPFAASSFLLEPGLWDSVRLAWRLFRDPRVTSRLKTAIPALALLYLLSPVDALPDLFLGLGQIDDLGVIGIVLVLMTRLLPRLAPPEVLAEHLAAMGMAPAPSSARRSDERGQADVIDATFRVRNESPARGGGREGSN